MTLMKLLPLQMFINLKLSFRQCWLGLLRTISWGCPSLPAGTDISDQEACHLLHLPPARPPSVQRPTHRGLQRRERGLLSSQSEGSPQERFHLPRCRDSSAQRDFAGSQSSPGLPPTTRLSTASWRSSWEASAGNPGLCSRKAAFCHLSKSFNRVQELPFENSSFNLCFLYSVLGQTQFANVRYIGWLGKVLLSGLRTTRFSRKKGLHSFVSAFQHDSCVL